MIKLFYAPDNASLIIRIILEELGIDYISELVDRSKKEQTSAEYLSLNPKGLILVPDIGDPCRAQFLKWLFFISNTLHPDLRQMFYADQFVGPDAGDQNAFRARVRERLHDTFTIIDHQYQVRDEDYLFGQAPSIIDIYLALCLRWAQIYPVSARGKMTSSNYPAVRKMLEKLQGRDAVVAACEKDGITGQFFSQPEYSNPLEGSAV